MSIDSVSNKSICAYPFTHSYIGSQYERKLCCVSDDIVELQKTNLKNFWNSDIMRDVRLKMINGEKISYCKRCYDFEQTGVPSLRQEVNKNYSLEKIGNPINRDHSMMIYYTNMFESIASYNKDMFLNYVNICNFTEELFKKGLFNIIHISTVNNFIKKYYSDDASFYIGYDNGKYKLYFDCNDKIICLYLNLPQSRLHPPPPRKID